MIDTVLDQLAQRGHIIGLFAMRNGEMYVEVDGILRDYAEVFALVRQLTE